MKPQAPKVPVKWRPSLIMVTSAVIVTMIALPLVGLFFFRLYENQLIRQTESELIAQSAVLAAAFKHYASDLDTDEILRGPERPPVEMSYYEDIDPFLPVEPKLDLTTDATLPERPDAQDTSETLTPAMTALGAHLLDLTEETRKITLAGFHVLDARGVIISGTNTGKSFAHVAEIQKAMTGHYASVMRSRTLERPAPPLYSLSRGTRIRIFTALPIFIDERVVGIVYASRTPENILKHLYRERMKVFLAALLTIGIATGVGAVFVRLINRPIARLSERTKAIATGDASAIGPLPSHGTRELARLTENFMSMAQQLSERSDYIRTFATHVSHELKTPLTAIRGAAEVLFDSGTKMKAEKRKQFLGNIVSDASRMALLLERLRDLARAETPNVEGHTSLKACTEALRQAFPALYIAITGDSGACFAMSSDNTLIVLKHLLDNAANHGAKKIGLKALAGDDDVAITVSDDGEGVSEGNRPRIFEAFFTTRRTQGGTGMGLGIVASLLKAHGGSIRLEPGAGLEGRGATFKITLPLHE